jgi:hypothetical protein
MRSRLAILPVLLVAVFALLPATAAVAASSHQMHIAQADTGDQKDGEKAPAAEEPGPLWTYQMARMSLGLLVVLFLGMGFWYYRLVVKRQRGV